MSLKQFHIFFITVSTLFLLALGVWAFSTYRSEGGMELAVMAGVGFVGAVGLVVYGVWFLRKINRSEQGWNGSGPTF